MYGRIFNRRVLGVSIVGFTGFTYYADPKVYGYKRPIVFWGILAPIFAHYKYVEYRTKDLSDEVQTERFRELHIKYAPRVLDLFVNLRGLFVKLGQVACSRADVLPKEYREVFKVLLDKAPFIEGQEAYELVEKSLGRKIPDVFSKFDATPIGSASIGQVHAATLLDGQEVVIKIQFAETKRAFNLDFFNGRQFARIAKPDQLPFMDEFETQFKLEFDFSREARMLERVGKSIHPNFKNVRIPIPYLELCTPTCIVMERFYGQKMIDGFKFRMNENAAKMGFASFEEMTQNFKDLQNKSKLVLYGTVIYRGTRLYLLNGVDLLKRLYNSTFGLIFPKFYFNKWHTIDADNIVQTIFKVHGHQVFKDGCFNADPHIGNIWLLDDNSIGLIDYGQVKELKPESVALLKQMYKGILINDRKAAVDAYKQMGYSSTKMDLQTTFEKIVFAYDKEDPNFFRKQNYPQYMQRLEEDDKTITIATDAIMVMRTSFLLRGLAAMLTGKRLSTAEMWKPYILSD